jgi:hypothetical protein
MTRSNGTSFLANLQQNLRVHTVAARLLSSPINHQWTVHPNDLVDVAGRLASIAFRGESPFSASNNSHQIDVTPREVVSRAEPTNPDSSTKYNPTIKRGMHLTRYTN